MEGEGGVFGGEGGGRGAYNSWGRNEWPVLSVELGRVELNPHPTQ